jgi:TPR repeat protein
VETELDSKFKEAEDIYSKAFFIDADAHLHDDVDAEYAKADEEWAKAFVIYESLAKKNHAEALYKQGYCYNLGTGVKQDYAKAKECFHKAAEQGHILAKEALEELKE